MVKSFRFFIRWYISCVKVTDSFHRYFIHILIHRLYITIYKCFYKLIRFILCRNKPPDYHFSKHKQYFSVCKSKFILIVTFSYHVQFLCRYNFKISACKHKTPHCILRVIKFWKYYLLINRNFYIFTANERFQHLFYIWTSFLNKIIYKSVWTWFCPI